MKKTFNIWAGLALFAVCMVWIPASNAAYYTVDEPAFSETVGDMLVMGEDGAAGTGQNYEVLKFKPTGNATSGTATDGFGLDQKPHGDVKVGHLWDFLSDLPSVTSLVFGFDVNEGGGGDYVVIDSLEFAIEDTYSYTLGAGNQVRVDDYRGAGSNVGEAHFQIDLPFDFMTRYNALSEEEFFVQATLSEVSSGFEEFYLSYSATASANAGAPVPEPGTLVLAGMGALGLFGARRSVRRRKHRA